jgi:hypothetical protein
MSKPDALADDDDVASANAELHTALAADDHVPIGHEVVLLQRRPVRDF